MYYKIILILSLIIGINGIKSSCSKYYNDIINSYIKNYGKDIYVDQMVNYYKIKMNLTDYGVKGCLNKKIILRK